MNRSWWGERTVPSGSAGRFKIGPLTLWIQRLRGEWRLAREVGADDMEDGCDVELPLADGARDLLQQGTLDRYAVSDTSDVVTLSAALADRAVITRPESPFHLPPGQEAWVYVGSPVWLQLAAGTDATPLLDAPIFRPSDTWFGPTTMEGELCYATRSYLRMNLEGLPRRPHRAITAARIINSAETPLDLQWLKLPVGHLELYAEDNGDLWTQDVTFEREGGHAGALAALRLRQRTPAQAANAKLIAAPRLSSDKGFVMQAFSSFFS